MPYIGNNPPTGTAPEVYTVDAPNIAAGAITNTKLGDASISTAKVQDSAITTAKIADGNVTDIKLASNSVTTAKVLDSNITTSKIADNAITTVKITDGNITNAKLGANSVTSAKITDGNITTTKIADGNVTYQKIDSGALASLSDWAAGTLSKLLTADQFLGALLAALGFRKTYSSGQQSFTIGTALNLTHGLGGIPSWCSFTLVCTTAELGYSVGDVVYSAGAPCFDGSSSGHRGTPTICANSTQITVITYNIIDVRNKTTGAVSAITAANWKIVVKAWI